MEYLKIKNTPLALVLDAKYSNNGQVSKTLPWQTLGFNPTVVKIKIIQYTTAEGDLIQVLPISVKGTFDNKFIVPFTADCVEYGLTAPEIIEEDAYQAELVTEAEVRATANATPV